MCRVEEERGCQNPGKLPEKIHGKASSDPVDKHHQLCRCTCTVSRHKNNTSTVVSKSAACRARILSRDRKAVMPRKCSVNFKPGDGDQKEGIPQPIEYEKQSMQPVVSFRMQGKDKSNQTIPCCLAWEGNKGGDITEQCPVCGHPLKDHETYGGSHPKKSSPMKKQSRGSSDINQVCDECAVYLGQTCDQASSPLYTVQQLTNMGNKEKKFNDHELLPKNQPSGNKHHKVCGECAPETRTRNQASSPYTCGAEPRHQLEKEDCQKILDILSDTQRNKCPPRGMTSTGTETMQFNRHNEYSTWYQMPPIKKEFHVRNGALMDSQAPQRSCDASTCTTTENGQSRQGEDNAWYNLQTLRNPNEVRCGVLMGSPLLKLQIELTMRIVPASESGPPWSPPPF